MAVFFAQQKFLTFFLQKMTIFAYNTFGNLTSRELTTSLVLNNRGRLLWEHVTDTLSMMLVK